MFVVCSSQLCSALRCVKNRGGRVSWRGRYKTVNKKALFSALQLSASACYLLLLHRLSILLIRIVTLSYLPHEAEFMNVSKGTLCWEVLQKSVLMTLDRGGLVGVTVPENRRGSCYPISQGDMVYWLHFFGSARKVPDLGSFPFAPLCHMVVRTQTCMEMCSRRITSAKKPSFLLKAVLEPGYRNCMRWREGM